MTGTPHYLEIVTPDVDGVCRLYAQAAGLAFGAGDQNLGGARIALLPGGARLGIRGPLSEGEGPLWRVYLRVDDLEAAVEKARGAGAEILLERMALGDGHGTIAIVRQGGVEHGLWQTK